MDQSLHPRESPEITARLTHFLSMFTSELLSPPEQQDMLRIFQFLAGQCLGHEHAGQPWQSALGVDGSPVELSVAVDHGAPISVRYIVDAQHRPARLADVRSTIGRNSVMVVPNYQERSELLDTILQRHLAGRPEFTVPFVGHGLRATPGKGSSGRIYFKVQDLSREEVRRTLSRCMHPNDLKALRSSCLSHLQATGVAYDFDASNLARIKIYFWTQGSAPEVGLTAAREFLGESCDSLAELLEFISYRRHPLWVIPSILIGLGFRPQGGFLDVKLCLPLARWGWRSFRQIMPVVTQILRKWGIDVNGTPPAPSSQPPWRFQPSFLSCDRSLRGDSLSVYFVPVRNPTGLCSSDSLRYTPRKETSISTSGPRTKAIQSAILQQMFDLLLDSDVCDGVAG